MSNHANAEFDSAKYYFPPGSLDERQPWLELRTERDEQGTPGLQVVPEEQKFAHPETQGRPYVAHIPTPPSRAIHADEFTSQGLQVVQAEQTQWPQPYPTEQSQEQWTRQNYLPPTASYSTPPLSGGYRAVSSLETSSQPDGDWSHSVRHQPWLPESQSTAASSLGDFEPALLKQPGVVPEDTRKIQRKRLLWIVAGIVAVLIIVGAVIGGVLASRAANKGTQVETPPASNTTGISTVTPLQSIRMKSRLAVSGFRGGSGNNSMRLFFQGPDKLIRFVDKSYPTAKWTNATVLDTLDHEPMENGSITAGMAVADKPYKIQLFYVDTTSTIRGQMFNFDNAALPLKGRRSSIDDWPLQVPQDSKISCYFPYIASQNKNNSMSWTLMLGMDGSNPSAPWWINDTNMDAVGSRGTGMVALPVGQRYLNAGGFVYRNSDGKLASRIRDAQYSSNAAASWTKAALSTEIPADSPIAAFAVGRPFNNANQINTYVLYQDAEGVIRVVWQDDDSGWKGPETQDVFADAEMGTDIACLTPGAWDAASITISREQDMNRCFFQEKTTGRVKEVWFDGTRWNNEGYVPLT